ncbi:MAG: hypothetical protein WAV25_00470 [Minisyncoccia bacterium]
MNTTEKEPQFVDLFSNEMETKFFSTEGKTYIRKIEPIKGARQVVEPTTVETRLPDGTLESTQEAKVGDWIITGSKGEEFVFTNSKFDNLYVADGKGGYIPRERKIIAIQNPFGNTVRISAPWGTAEKPAFQDGGEKCMFVVEITSGGEMTKDRYIIGDEEMLLNNYNPIN